jgi:hypothetical protein
MWMQALLKHAHSMLCAPTVSVLLQILPTTPQLVSWLSAITIELSLQKDDVRHEDPMERNGLLFLMSMTV